jgi:hypothetical protein
MEKHRAVIKGNVSRLIYRYDRGWDVYSSKFTVAKKTVWSGELDLPLLKQGELLYIEDIDETVEINARVRSTSGEYIYFTEFDAEVIEDEITLKSKEKAEAEYEKYKIENKLELSDNWFQKLFRKG